MKRKRGAKKAPKKGKRNDHAELNDAATALVSINVEDTTCLDQNKGNEHNCKMDIEPQVFGVDKLNDISSIEADQHKDSFMGQRGPVVPKVKFKSSKALGHHRSQSYRQTCGGTDKSNQQAASESNMHREKEDSTCSEGLTLEMQNGISEMIAKLAGSTETKSSEGLGLLNEGLQDKNLNAANSPLHMLVERNLVHANKGPYRDSSYNEKELTAALMVIKKIMKMNAAEPFNAPVDPVDLGISDYFDIIDTPMDFGTICHDLEHGYKYTNAKGVFKDVQFIWENCNKYNKKGDYIMDLMGRVKKNFMKYWTAAQLYVDKPNDGEMMESSRGQATVKGKKGKAMKKKTLQGLESDVPSRDDPSISSMGVASPTSLRTGIDAFEVDNASTSHDPTDSQCKDMPMDPPCRETRVDPPCSVTPVDPSCREMPADPSCRDTSVNPPGVCGSNIAPTAVPLSGSSSPHPTVSPCPSSSSPEYVLSPQPKRGCRPSRRLVEPDTPVGVTHVSGSSSSTMPDNSRTLKLCKRRGRGPTKPSSYRPKTGEEPFILIWVGGAPVGDHARHFGCYCAEEAKIYLKYPLHLKWGTEQTAHVRSFYYSAQQRDYRFVGEEDPNNEGQRLPVDEEAALIWIKDAIQHAKRGWRNTIKYEYYRHWATSDDVGREAILNSLPSRVPKEMWPLLCSHFERPEKQAEARRNSHNRNNIKKPMARPTQGSISLANANYRLKKELKQEYNPAKAWVLMHQSRDPQSVEYRKKFEEAVNGLSLAPDSDASTIAPVLDAIRAGHHGVYERGIGRARGHRRKVVDDSSAPLRSYNQAGARETEMKSQMEQQQQQIKEQQQQIKEQQQQMQDTRREMEEQRRLVEKLRRRLDRHASSSRAAPAPLPQPAGLDLSMFLNAMTTACLNLAAMRPPANTSLGDSNRCPGGAGSSSTD